MNTAASRSNGLRLPPGHAAADPVAWAASVPGTRRCLFQRFDLATRRLRKSVIVLAVRELQGADLADALRSAFSDGMDQAPVFIYAGVESISGLAAPADEPRIAWRLERYVEIDHDAGTATLFDSAGDFNLPQLPPTTQASPSSNAHAATANWTRDVDEAAYAERVAAIRSAVHAGEVDGAVLSVGLSRATTADPFDIYRECVAANPSPYGYALQDGTFSLVGSSPLAFMQLKNGTVHLETDAGTRPVTRDAAVDDAAEADLRVDPKDAAEHQVVVDAELEALQPIAHGRVEAVVSHQVRRFSHVMHLYSAFEAKLRPGLDAVDAIAALAPAAAVSGYPKREALQLGLTLEGAPRGPYGGIAGLVSSLHDADLAVVIRSLWIKDGVARLRVGGKVVADSQAASEWNEALSKSRFLVDATARAEIGR